MPVNKSAKAALAEAKPGQDGLGLLIKDAKVVTGEFVPKANAQTAPTLTLPSTFDSTKTFLIVALDLDAPFPSFALLGPILHWIQPDVTLGADGKLSSSAAFVADYIGPAPPPGSGPHRYAFYLYEQPAGFDAKKFAPPNGAKYAVSKRMRFDLDAWEKEAGLGAILGCTYFKSN